MDRETAFNKGERVAKIGFVAVAALGVAKGAVGLYSGSVSLTAQAVDSVTDLLALIAVFVGLRVSRRDPTEKFPYGFYRVETVASLIVAVLILVTGGEILRESLLKLLSPEPLSNPLGAVVVSGASIPLLYLLAHYVKGVGEEVNSKSLMGQAADFKVDAYSSALVLLGVASSILGYPFVDGVVGALISLFVLKVGLTLGWDALLVLVDAVAEPEKMVLMKKTAEEVRGVLGVHRVRIRRSGPFCMGQLTINVDEGLAVEEAHNIADEVEDRIKEKFPEVESIVIHVEPQERKDLRIAIPILEDRGIESTAAGVFGEAPYFLFVDVKEGSVRRWATRPNPGYALEKKRGLTTSHLLLDERATTLLVRHMGEGPFYFLRSSFIDVYEMPRETNASEAVDEFLNGKLSKIEEPEKDEEHRGHGQPV